MFSELALDENVLKTFQRNILGTRTLSEILAEREVISEEILKILDKVRVIPYDLIISFTLTNMLKLMLTNNIFEITLPVP